MKILLCSYVFPPSVGGIETVSRLVAEQFHALGHEVVIVTQTASPLPDAVPYPVLRRPGPLDLIRAHRRADLVLHSNISLRLAWPLLLVRRPWVVVHHTWIPGVGIGAGRGAWAGRLKRWWGRRATVGAVSRALADSLGGPVECLPNPYDTGVFRQIKGVRRLDDIIYVGRLVSDKGVQVLLDALAILHREGRGPRLTIVGSGPEEPALRARVQTLGLEDTVRFAGNRFGEPLARLLNAHLICVVPSVWEEPFGIVALEALACGCIPVVSRSGGLPEAVGSCGVVVPKSNAPALAEAIRALLAEPGRRGELLVSAAPHLSRHEPSAVAARYLGVFERALASGRAA